MKEDKTSFVVKYLKVSQPIGDFYIASMTAKRLVQITEFDVRRVLIDQRDVERYLGIQRPLIPKRVKEIGLYVRTMDACFPTGVIIAIPAKCIELDEDKNEMTISNYVEGVDEEDNVLYKKIARVLDGQHRLAGLEDFDGIFEINVSIFVDADIADQANIFSTVNLAQTKVSKSLVYDLFDLMKSRSPQKICHNIAVTLDRDKDSPFYKMIKRLGASTPGRSGETLTQAAFVEPLLQMISENPMLDRDFYLRGKKPIKIDEGALKKYPFQHMFVDERDFDITDILWNYFSAAKDRWSTAWASRDRGVMLNRTNGYRALMRFLGYLYTGTFTPGTVPTKKQFKDIFSRVQIVDNDFNVDNFPPGTSGESTLLKTLIEQAGRL
jgi:DGQHR domain-containing protein